MVKVSDSQGEAEKNLKQGCRLEAEQKNRFLNHPRHSRHCKGVSASISMIWYVQLLKLKPCCDLISSKHCLTLFNCGLNRPVYLFIFVHTELGFRHDCKIERQIRNKTL